MTTILHFHITQTQRSCAITKSYTKGGSRPERKRGFISESYKSTAMPSCFNPQMPGSKKRSIAQANVCKSPKMLGDSANVVRYSICTHISQLKECKSLKVSIALENMKIYTNC